MGNYFSIGDAQRQDVAPRQGEESNFVTGSGFETIFDDKVVEVNTGEILEDKTSTGKIRDWNGKKGMNLKMSDLYEKAMLTGDKLITPARLQDTP